MAATIFAYFKMAAILAPVLIQNDIIQKLTNRFFNKLAYTFARTCVFRKTL